MRTLLYSALVLISAGAAGAACGDDTILAPADAGSDASLGADVAGYETGTFDGSLGDDGGGPPGLDAASVAPARLLFTIDTASAGALAVFGLRASAVDGTLAYPGGEGTAIATANQPWLLEGQSDTVVRLDPIEPWIPRSSWTVGAPDGDAGDAAAAGPAEPVALVAGPGTKAYVLRHGRNELAVIDTSQDVTLGAPGATVPMEGLVQAGGDGVVEMSAAAFDGARQRLYVLLGNVDRSAVGADGVTLRCGPTAPTLAAIDTTNDVLVPFAGDAGAAARLSGFAPPVGSGAIAYDVAGDRVLVLERGCSDEDSGAVVRRGIESVSLVDGHVTPLLDLSALAAPRGLWLRDAHHAVVLLDVAYAWDPASPTLGAPLAGAPTVLAVDATGALVGVSPAGAADAAAGAAGWNVVSLAPDGGMTTFAQGLFSSTGGVVGTVALWPPP